MTLSLRGMNFNTLVKKSGITVLSRGGEDDPFVKDIVYDSRKSSPKTVYTSIPGTKINGDSFIRDAIDRGTVAIISETPHPELSIPWVQTKGIRACLGILGRTLWNIDDKAFVSAGVTGTNGKTTVAHLLDALFSSVYGASRVWMLGTIKFRMGEQNCDASHTTPEAVDIFRYIATAAEPPSALVMEVSSHSLELDRIGGLSFDIGVFTNLTQDHLDFHKNMESYYQAKRKLFFQYLRPEGLASINIDDKYGRRLAEELGRKKCLTYGKAEDADIRITDWNCSREGCRIETLIRGNRATFRSGLQGFFNIYNMAALICAATAGDFKSEQIQEAFDRVPSVKGRMEPVNSSLPFSVIVDYAHTPDALENVLKTARQMTCGRVLCVFGCGGDRDKTKRPLMGAAVAANCDEAWVTSDNPRSEKPGQIINEITEGIPLDFPFHIQPDRRSAIREAIYSCREGDCLIIAGKGHESYQEINGVRYPFDDMKVAEEICSELSCKKALHKA